MAGKIFISYRRGVDSSAAGRLYDRLEMHVGRDRLFMDVDDIPFGVDFVDYLSGRVAECTHLIAVIGQGWIDAAPRLQNEDDFVRIEIEAAMVRPEVRVIPVLLDTHAMPPKEALPDALHPFRRRNGLKLPHDHFAAVVDRRLLPALGELPAEPEVAQEPEPEFQPVPEPEPEVAPEPEPEVAPEPEPEPVIAAESEVAAGEPSTKPSALKRRSERSRLALRLWGAFFFIVAGGAFISGVAWGYLTQNDARPPSPERRTAPTTEVLSTGECIRRWVAQDLSNRNEFVRHISQGRVAPQLPNSEEIFFRPSFEGHRVVFILTHHIDCRQK